MTQWKIHGIILLDKLNIRDKHILHLTENIDKKDAKAYKIQLQAVKFKSETLDWWYFMTI